MDSKKIIAHRINDILAIKGVKQKDLAKQLGVTDNTISYYCSGARTPSVSQIIQISKILDVSSDFLLGISPTVTKDQTVQSIVSQLGLPEYIIELLITWNNIQNIAKKEKEDLTSAEKLILNLVDDIFPMQENRYFLAQENFQTFITYILSAFCVDHDQTDRTANMLYNFYKARDALNNDRNYMPNSESETEEYIAVINKLYDFGMIPMLADDVGKWFLDSAFKSITIRVHNDIKEFG